MYIYIYGQIPLSVSGGGREAVPMIKLFKSPLGCVEADWVSSRRLWQNVLWWQSKYKCVKECRQCDGRTPEYVTAQLKYKLTVNSTLIYYEFYIGRLFSLFFSLGNISSIFSVMGIFTNWKAQFVWMFMCERNHMSEYVLFWAFVFMNDNENVAPLIMSIGHADWAIHVHKHGDEIQKMCGNYCWTVWATGWRICFRININNQQLSSYV